MLKILVIEDDNPIRTGLEETLRVKGYDTYVAKNGTQGLDLFRKTIPDLVILDLMLPDMDGFDICRQMKASDYPDIPIIMLTAKGAELDRVKGLHLGADDYVTKPFSLMELLARIAAVLRRTQNTKPSPLKPDKISFGDIVIDFRRHEATKSDKPLKLSDRAYLILHVFARHRGQVISREKLLEDAWGYSKELNTRTVDNHIVKIRQQIENDPNSPRYLTTIHGVGYKLSV